MTGGSPGRRLGRPPGDSADETRERILAAARESFSLRGFAATTNQHIADSADITTGAIYHYFDSKRALFVAVTNEVMTISFSRFESVVDAHDRFADRLSAVLEQASLLHQEDPSLGRFAAIFPLELTRHPELAAQISADGLSRAEHFFRRLTEEAEAASELPPGISATDAAAAILALTMGIANFGVMNDEQSHRAAVRALQAFLAPSGRSLDGIN